jgi:membrane dipeptidase
VPAAEPAAQRLEEARSILRRVPLVDGHNDLPWAYRENAGNHLARIDLRQSTRALDPPLHTDLERLRAGGVGAQFWSVYIPVSMAGPGAIKATLEQIDVVHRLVELYPESFELASTAADVRRIHATGKIASLIGMEGGHSIENSLAALRQLYRAGARYLTLTHNTNTDWADAATDAPEHGGLSVFGREVVHEMNRLGMLVDLSHVSAETMHDALDASAAPVLFSHSSARALCGHARNVPDDVLARLPGNGGVVMITFVESFLSEEVRQYNARRDAEEKRLGALHPGDPAAAKAGLEAWKSAQPAPRATLAQVADHIDHVRKIAGIDHVGLGGDFDGMPRGPVGLEDVAGYPNLLAELLARGYSPEDLAKVAGLNVLRVLERAEQVAAGIQHERPASDLTIEEASQPAPPAGEGKP